MFHDAGSLVQARRLEQATKQAIRKTSRVPSQMHRSDYAHAREIFRRWESSGRGATRSLHSRSETGPGLRVWSIEVECQSSRGGCRWWCSGELVCLGRASRKEAAPSQDRRSLRLRFHSEMECGIQRLLP